MPYLTAQWIHQSSSVSAELRGIYFINSNIGWVCGTDNNSLVLQTTNGGDDWYPQARNVSEKLNSISCSDDQNCWIVGRHGLILNTRDGGEHWDIQESNISNDLNDVKFFDNHHGWAVGDKGVVLKYGTITNLKICKKKQ